MVEIITESPQLSLPESFPLLKDREVAIYVSLPYLGFHNGPNGLTFVKAFNRGHWEVGQEKEKLPVIEKYIYFFTVTTDNRILVSSREYDDPSDARAIAIDQCEKLSQDLNSNNIPNFHKPVLLEMLDAEKNTILDYQYTYFCDKQVDFSDPSNI